MMTEAQGESKRSGRNNLAAEFSPALVCFDIDGTLFEPIKKSRGRTSKELIKLLSVLRGNGTKIVYMTGRGRKDAHLAIRDNKLPIPDFLITDLGWKIYDSRNKVLASHSLWIKEKNGFWSKSVIDKCISDFTEILPRKASRSSLGKRSFYLYGLSKSKVEEVLSSLKKKLRIRKISSNVFYSKKKYLYITPILCSKVRALNFLLKKQGLSRYDVLVAGDDETDEGVLVAYPHSILVGNASSSVRRSVKSAYPNAFLSRESSSLGLVDGIYHFLNQRRKFVEKEAALLKTSSCIVSAESISVATHLEICLGDSFEEIGNFRKALKHYEKAKKFALKIGNKYLLALSDFHIARANISLGHVEIGLRTLSIVEKEAILDRPLQIRILNAIAYGYRILGKNTKAKIYISRALGKIRYVKGNKYTLQASVLHNKAGLSRDESNYKSALHTYTVVQGLEKNSKDEFFLARVLNNIGFIYRKIGNYKKAKSFYLRAYNIECRLNAKQLQGRTLNNLGGVARMNGEYKSAYKLFSQSAKIRRAIGDNLGLSSSLLNKGIVLKEMKRPKEAQKYLLESYKIRKMSRSKLLAREVSNELKIYGKRI